MASRNDKVKVLQRLVVQVDMYIQLQDKLHLGSRPDVAVDAGAQKRPRRDGKAPTGDAAHRFFTDPDNQDAASKIEPAIAALRHSRSTYKGISLYYCVCTVGYGGAWGVDFAELRRWQGRRSQDARDHHDAYQAALDILARMIWVECKRRDIPPDIKVNPKGDDGKSDEQAESKAAAAHQDADETKQRKREKRDGQIRQRYRHLKEETHMTDSQIRNKLCVDFAPSGSLQASASSQRRKMSLSRETINRALRESEGSAA